MRCLRMKTTWRATELTDEERPGPVPGKPEAGTALRVFQSYEPVNYLFCYVGLVFLLISSEYKFHESREFVIFVHHHMLCT